MKKIVENKKIIITILLVLIIVLIGIIIIKNITEKEKKEKIELGNSMYEKIHNLYYYGGNIEYKEDEKKQKKYIEIEEERYYEISNPEEITDLITEKMYEKASAFLKIKEVEEKYYMKDYGRGLSGYYGTELEIKEKKEEKIEYKAKSKFCEIENRVSYGSGCSEEKYYYIEKPFIIVKEKGKWKVEEYTSVFEIEKTEFK